MLQSTRGILLKVTDYSESSVVAQVFTEKFGLQSYLIRGVKKPSSKIKLNILQPLYLLDMVVENKATASLQRASEIRHLPVFRSIPYHIVKSTIVLFLNEVIYRAVRQQHTDVDLFGFMFHSIELIDRLDDALLANVHLVFLFRLTRFLGFYPTNPGLDRAGFFDLRQGAYTDHPPQHSQFLAPPLTGCWSALALSSYDTLAELRLSPAERRSMLQALVDYYRLHIDGFGEVRSLQVLEEVMRG